MPQNAVNPGFEGVQQAFEENFNDGLELGASLCVVHQGQVVVDLNKGYSDRAQSKPWNPNTIVNVFSSTKGVVAAALTLLHGRGDIDYEKRVSEYWPEFSAADKQDITLGTALSHQSGLSGLRETVTIPDLYDWSGMVKRVAAAAPLWEPGTNAGYHPLTWGYIAGEIIRRITGQTPGDFIAQELGALHEGNFLLGVPASEDGRVAEVRTPEEGVPQSMIDEMGETLRLTMLNPFVGMDLPGDRDWRASQVPGANGHGNGRALARVFGALANDGALEGQQVFKPESIKAATEVRFDGMDMTLGFQTRWGAGFFLNNDSKQYGPSPNAFGHSGMGGSMEFADPDQKLGVGYTPSQMGTDLNGDRRALRLVDAIYKALG